MNCSNWLCFQNTYSKYNYTFGKALDPVEEENRKKDGRIDLGLVF